VRRPSRSKLQKKVETKKRRVSRTMPARKKAVLEDIKVTAKKRKAAPLSRKAAITAGRKAKQKTLAAGGTRRKARQAKRKVKRTARAGRRVVKATKRLAKLSPSKKGKTAKSTPAKSTPAKSTTVLSTNYGTGPLFGTNKKKKSKARGYGRR